MEDEETKKQRRGGWRTGKELCDDVFNVVARELPKMEHVSVGPASLDFAQIALVQQLSNVATGQIWRLTFVRLQHSGLRVDCP